jgi:hypothetical protein
MDQESREKRNNIREGIENRAAEMLKGGVPPFSVQKMRAAAGQELARAIPDVGKYQQSVMSALQFRQKGAI